MGRLKIAVKEILHTFLAFIKLAIRVVRLSRIDLDKPGVDLKLT